MGERVWGWDIVEMRHAATMDSQVGVQVHQYPRVSGFTPINGPQTLQSIANSPAFDNRPNPVKADKKVKAQRKTQASCSKPKLKPQKAGVSKRGKKRKAADGLDRQDISQDLPRIKPAYSGNGMPFHGTTSPDDTPSFNQKTNVNGFLLGINKHDDSRDDEPTKSCLHPLGLADKYQAEYASVKESNAGQVAVHVGGEISDKIEDFVPEPAVGAAISKPALEAGSVECQELRDDVDHAFQEILNEPSAQRETILNTPKAQTSWKDSDGVDRIPKRHLDSDDFFSDAEESDDFVVDDEGFAELIKSVHPLTGQEEHGQEWWFQESMDDVLMFEGVESEESQLQSKRASVKLQKHPGPISRYDSDHSSSQP